MGIFRQFPYSNFHEMNMDEILKIVKTLSEEWDATKSEWASYKDFIDNYFANLNLDAETEKALRKLVADGTLDSVIDPVIIAEVETWLTNHVSQPTTPVIDKSLSIEGAAADAKATGIKINNTNTELNAFEEMLSMVVNINYPDGTHSYVPLDKRLFYPNIIPAQAILNSLQIPIGVVGSNPYLIVEIWEIESNNTTLRKVQSQTITEFTNNTPVEIVFNHYSENPRYISYHAYNVQTFYRTGQTGEKFLYINDITDINTFQISSLLTYNNMTLVGSFSYLVSGHNQNFFSGWQSGNIVVFGDSTVDGTSTTGHTGNVIGTDRTATDEPNVFTSLVEHMLNTFTNGSTRIYNAGYGGKTLDYIVDNYATIMNAFTNVKSALIILDVNSAAGSRIEYENSTRNNLINLINLLRRDNIAISIASPQPMFYYPADNAGLPAINSAGEFAIAVNIAKDICDAEKIPFINLGEITNNIMSSPYFKTTDFYGDRIHFGDGGHKFEAYELYGELIHPIVIFESAPIFVNLDSNMGELSANSGISAGNIDGYRSIVLGNDHTRTDILHRIYIIAKAPFKISGINIDGWVSYYNVYVDGTLYTSNTTNSGETIAPGCHEITVKPTGTNHVVRYSGLIFEQI